MRLSVASWAILACFVAIVAAWSKEDQEIFRLRNEVEAVEGEGVTFYDFLETKPNANQDEINAAYKKRARVLHPDKVKKQFIKDKTTVDPEKKKTGVKKPSKSEIDAAAKAASDRFARLGIVTNILRGEGRARYDHFLSNGFPKWKGTGYYYARFRPGLGSVLVSLFVVVGGGGHWLFLYLSWKRQQEFVGRYITSARRSAWGETFGIDNLGGSAASSATTGTDDSPAMPVNRKQRRFQEKGTKKVKTEKKLTRAPSGTPPSGATGPKKRVMAENGKVLIVDIAGNVYLEQADEDGNIHEYLLDPNEMLIPTFRDTSLYRIPLWAYNSTAGRFLNKATDEDEIEEEEAEEEVANSSSSGAESFEVLEKVKTTAANGKPAKKAKKNARR